MPDGVELAEVQDGRHEDQPEPEDAEPQQPEPGQDVKGERELDEARHHHEVLGRDAECQVGTQLEQGEGPLRVSPFLDAGPIRLAQTVA